MALKESFKACRVCLTTDSATEFKQLGEFDEIIRFISGVDLSIDKGKYDALVCDVCIKDLERVRQLGENIKNAEKTFSMLRNSYTENDSKDVKNLPLVMFIEVEPEQLTNSGLHEAQGGMITEQMDVDVDSTNNHEEAVAEPTEEHPVQNPAVKNLRKMLKCPKCTKTFVASEKLQSHKDSHAENHMSSDESDHEEANLSTRQRKVPLKKPFECLKCHRVFSGRSEFQYHSHKCPQNKSTSKIRERRFQCGFAECKMKFFCKQSLKRHQVIHFDARPFVCWCGASFKRSSNLHVHQKGIRVHKNLVQ